VQLAQLFDPAWLILFSLVLSRISGLLMTLPAFGPLEVPGRIRALLAVALTLVLVPTQASGEFVRPTTVVEYGLLVGSELLVGAALGLGVAILVSGIQMAGLVVSQLSGLSLAEALDPSFDASVPLFSELLRVLTVVTFLAIGGHRLVLGGLMDTFAAIPPGQPAFAAGVPAALSTLVGESLALGLRAAAPTIVATLLATLVLGLIGRAVPQLNVLAVGFGMNTLVALGAFALSLAGVVWLFQDALEPTVNAVLEALAPAR
jgi:flagellar biosynthetic protein FliR